MKTTRSRLLIVALAGIVLLPLAGCGDNDNDFDIDNPSPTATTGGGTTPVPTQTPAPGATATAVATEVNPTATPDTAETPTPQPTGGGACTDPSVVVQVSIDQAYGAARIDLAYLSSLVNIPGSGTAASVTERVAFAGNGLTTVNDDDNISTLTASLVSFAEQPSGLFVTVTFDCVSGGASAGDFSCTVVSASTPGGVAIPDAACSVSVQ